MGFPGREKSILEHSRAVLGLNKRVRKVEFFDLPKTISGKIRRIELQRLETGRCARAERGCWNGGKGIFGGPERVAAPRTD